MKCLDYNNEIYETKVASKMIYPICFACNKSIKDNFLFTRLLSEDVFHLSCIVSNKKIRDKILEALKDD